MPLRSLLILATLLALTACGGGSSRPVYSGHEESTAGVPGFSPDGQRKLHPNVKLGQSYTVGGKTYVPRYQPDYDEEGMASWYGPGFHGGRTANGETFSTHDYTAAHTTLPMPSIVRVTYLKTGRSAYARINDRGPFAHGRIIDVSKAVAEDIGMIRDGVGRVRVQYMPAESEKFVEMIVAGRDPASIDIAREVVGRMPSGSTGTMYANVPPPDDSVQVVDTMTPAAPAVVSAPLPPAQQVAAPVASPMPQPATVVAAETLPPATLPAAQPVIVVPTPAPVAQQAPAPVVNSGLYVQLGAYANQANAMNVQQRFGTLGGTEVTPVTNASGATLYRVRIGPLVNEEAAVEILERAKAMGVGDAKLVRGQ